MTSMQSIQAGKAHVTLSVNTAKLNDGIKKANAILRQFAGNAAKIFRDAASTHYSLENIINPVITAYASFDGQMRLTRAVTGATAEYLTIGEPDAGNPHVRFGGRGWQAIGSAISTLIQSVARWAGTTFLSPAQLHHHQKYTA